MKSVAARRPHMCVSVMVVTVATVTVAASSTYALPQPSTTAASDLRDAGSGIGGGGGGIVGGLCVSLLVPSVGTVRHSLDLPCCSISSTGGECSGHEERSQFGCWCRWQQSQS